MTLDEYLRQQKLTEASFAEVIGSTQQSVHRYRRNTRVPRPAVMERIVAATGGKVSPDDFYPA